MITAFVEKPERATAETYLASGDYLWNGGIFLLPAQALVSEFERLAPDLLSHAKAALSGASRDIDFLRLDPAAFAQCPSISIDPAVGSSMKFTQRSTVDLPDPERPKMTTTSPLCTSMSTPRTTSR